MADGSVTIEVTLSKEQLEKGLKSIKSSINSVIPSASSTLSGLSSAFGAIGSAATAAGKVCSTVTAAVTGVFTAAATKAYSFIEVYESAMAVFERKLGSETSATEMYNQLLDIAKGSKFAQEYIVSAGQVLVGMGVNAEDTAKYVQIATNAISAMGGTASEVESLAEMFGKMSLQTTLYTDDLNQMLTAGIPVYDILAKKYNTTTSAIKEMASNAELTSDDFEYLTEVLNGNVEGMEEFSLAGLALAGKTGTLSGALDSLNSSFRTFALNLLDIDPRTDEGSESINKLITVVNALGSFLETLGEKFSFVGDWIRSFIDKLATAEETVDEAGNTITTYGGILGNLISKLESIDTSTLETFASAILKIAAAGPILLTVGKGFSTLSSAFKGLSKVSKAIENLPTKISSVVSGIKKSVSGFSLSSLFSSAFSVVGVTAVIALLVAGLGLLQQNFGEQINAWAQTAIEQGPTIIQNLVNGIVSALPNLIAQGSQLIQTLLEVIIANAPTLIQGGIQIIATLMSSIAEQLPTLLPMALELILTIVEGLIGNIDQIISAGLQLIVGLAEGIVNAIPTLVDKIPDIISALVSGIINLLPQIISTGIQLLVTLATGLIAAIPQLVAMIPEIITALIEAFLNIDWLSVGKQILEGIMSGFSNVGNIVWNAVKSVGNSIVSSVKNFFGIASPSKLMRDEIGKFLPSGIAVGVEANTDQAIKAVDSMNDSIMDRMLDANVDMDNVYDKLQSAVSLESVKLSNNISSTALVDKTLTANINMEPGNVYLDRRKVGQSITPNVTKTLRSAGI